MNKEEFKLLLEKACRDNGVHSAACIRMDNPLLKRHIRENNTLVAGWLEKKMHGEMQYLERLASRKADPWSAFPFARSVIVLAFTNRWGDPEAKHPFPVPGAGALLGYISAYAKEIDYHARGQNILAAIRELLGREVQAAEAAVDTKAVYERLFAITGGLGIRGANDLLRVPDRTNVRTFIGCLFVDAELPEVIHDPQMPFSCDDCRACIKRCPTGAIRFGEPIDAPKCISYLTIEKRGILNRQEGEMIGDWIFGCDWCSTVCPPKDKTDLRIPIDLEWLIKTPAAEIRRMIEGNAVSYAGVTQLRKNAAVLLKKSSSPLARELLQWLGENTGSELIRDQLTAW